MSNPISGPSADMSSSVESVLAQMRAMQSQATALPSATALQGADVGAVATARAQTPGFSELLSGALQSVSALQQTSSAMAGGFARGEHQDLVGTMIASQKSSIAFQSVVTARNRMVAAYQDIMNMPI